MNPSQAALAFATVYRHNTELTTKAREQLSAIYQAAKPEQKVLTSLLPPFEKQADNSSPSRQGQKRKLPRSNSPITQARRHAADAMSTFIANGRKPAWRRCCAPTQPQNVIGDFEEKNEFVTGEELAYPRRQTGGRCFMTIGALFARMVIRGGRHYFDIKESDGRWHSYPVDYTIGSKWQQAYATKLANGQIHVFPIQYSTIEKKWLNYWKVIDSRRKRTCRSP